MRKYREDIVAVLLSLSSLAVVVFVIIYIVNLQPYAKKSDIRDLERTAVTASNGANAAQQKANAASALVSTTSQKHTQQLRGADARIKKLEDDYALLKSRVDLLDGTALRTPRAVKHAQ